MSHIHKVTFNIKNSSNVRQIEYMFEEKRMFIGFAKPETPENINYYKYEEVDKEDILNLLFLKDAMTSVGSYVNGVLLKKYKGVKVE